MDEVFASEERRRVVEHSPQLPQGFTPVSDIVFWPGQKLQATCQFNSTERDDVTWAGATHHHEMCNLYMIMWSELPVFINCYDNFTAVDYHGAGLPLPHDSLIPSAPFLLQEMGQVPWVKASSAGYVLKVVNLGLECSKYRPFLQQETWGVAPSSDLIFRNSIQSLS